MENAENIVPINTTYSNVYFSEKYKHCSFKHSLYLAMSIPINYYGVLPLS